MSRRHVETITEWLIVAVSPALVIFMVGSLVFFATHCFYDGNFHARLRFAAGLFVIAAVLVSRISIEEGREYARMFAIPLGIVTILSMLKYTDGGLLVIPLVAFIWWSTDKLTWDCTVLDDRKDASGEGLLQTIGMETDDQAELDQEATTSRKQSDAQSTWARWVARRRRHHTPGVWVIYFGLAAIPLFGLGQLLLPPHSHGVGFLLLCIYLASALALLLTTSFLQMRRYLIQRRLPFTDSMASIWLGTGGTIIVGLMIACLFLPRPNTGYSLIDSFHKVTSHERRASKVAVGKEGTVDQTPGEGESDDEADTDSEQGTQTSRDARQGSQPGEKAEAKGGQDSDSGRSQESSSRDSSSGQSDDEAQEAADGGANQPARDAQEQPAEGQPTDGTQNTENSSERPTPDAPRQLLPPNLIPDSLPSIPKLVYLLILGILVVLVFLKYGREIGEAIQAFCRDLLEMLRRLFGGKDRPQEAELEQPNVPAAQPARAFSSFQDPFLLGTVDRFTPSQLVNYTFEALQAWARERDCARSAEQTPLEFAANLTAKNRRVAASARNLAILYNQAAYAPGTIGKESIDHVKRVWQALRGQPQ